MKLELLEQKEYQQYACNHPLYSIYQSASWGLLKHSTGWDYYYLGLKEENNIYAATLLLRKKVIANLYLFYAPRGYLIDNNNKDLLKTFHDEVIGFVKKEHGFMLKIDPNIIYNIRDKDGQIIKELNHDSHEYLCSLGYKHLGFNINFETMQPRFLCRYLINNSYEDTISTFTKSTVKNVKKAYDMGVRTEVVEKNNLEQFVSVLNKTAEENHFAKRPAWYYEKIYDLFPDEVVYFLTYIDTKIYLECVEKNIQDCIKNEGEIKNKIEKYANVGNKLKTELNQVTNRKEKLEEELVYAKELRGKSDKIYIGALFSVFTNNEGITFNSGTDSQYRRFNIKYAYYDAHLKESIKRNMKYVNFYGISGSMDPNSRYYHIYEIKKGYNPEIIELLGEYDYIISRSKYLLYKIILKIYKLLKK